MTHNRPRPRKISREDVDQHNHSPLSGTRAQLNRIVSNDAVPSVQSPNGEQASGHG